MTKPVLISVVGLLLGVAAGVLIIKLGVSTHSYVKTSAPKQVIGFLPYWQLEEANPKEEEYLTTLTYFGLKLDGGGHIVKMVNDQQEDPGWYDLQSGKLDKFLENAKTNRIKLSLLLSLGNADIIHKLISKPTANANTLVKEVTPIMKKYHFTDLNLDIEDSSNASPSDQNNFTQLIQAVKQQVDKAKLGSLTLEISTADTIKYNLIYLPAIAPYADTIILMAYDFHSPTSVVTGPVAPLGGAGKTSEYDVTTAVEKSLQAVPPNKLILGMPLYGYEWETLNNAVRSAIIPSSGVLASNNRVETLLTACASCSAFFDDDAKEEFIVYLDESSGTYHQISFPNQLSVQAKLTFANKENLGGVALWALGYEGNTMLTPLAQYKH